MDLKQSKILVKINYKSKKIKQIELYDRPLKDIRVIMNKYIIFLLYIQMLIIKKQLVDLNH